LELWRSPAGIFAIPATYLEHFSGLPCQLLGLKVAEETPAGFIPAHDWVARFGQHFHESRLTIAKDQVTMWLRGEDLTVDGVQDGLKILFDADGRCLGRGRVRAGTVKNLLPRRFF
jgi:NOL1/NOP2/fmu family ribosome biogenesis protein